MHTYFSFGLILRDIPNSIKPQTTLRLLPIPVGLLVFPCTRQCRRSPPPPPPYSLLPFFPGPDRDTGEGRYLCPWQACALNVHVKHSDLTWPHVEVPWLWRPLGNCQACPVLNPALGQLETHQLLRHWYRKQEIILSGSLFVV